MYLNHTHLNLLIYSKHLAYMHKELPKGYSETVNRWRTDNTIAKRKGKRHKQWSTKHYTELSSTKRIQVLQTDEKFLLF